MKILFFGDYSNLHTTLGVELKRRGHSVTLLSDRCGCLDTESDIYLARGKYPGAGFPYLFKTVSLMPRLKGYDVVQFINPHFLNLRPGKLSFFLRMIRRNNGSLFLTLAGNDHFFVKECLAGKMFRFSEFRVGSDKTRFAQKCPGHERGYMLPEVRDYSEEFYGLLDGAMSALPEYDMAARAVLGDRLAFTNLPIDLSLLKPSLMDLSGKVELMVGMRSELVSSKGTDVLFRIASELAAEHPDRINVANVVDLPWKQYIVRLSKSHVVLDQLYSYSPGMNALNTMALGRVSGSGAQKEYYEYIGEREMRPIIELSPIADDLKARIASVALDKSRLAAMALESRKLVEHHNDVRIVADRYEAHWDKMLNRR